MLNGLKKWLVCFVFHAEHSEDRKDRACCQDAITQQ